MSQNLIRVLIPAIIAVILGVLLLYNKKSSRKEAISNLSKNHVVLKLPTMYLWVGCIDVSVFTAFIFLMYYYPNDTAALWIYVVFGLFELLGIFLVVATLLWRIDVFRDKNFFVYRTSFGKKHTIKYDDCVSRKFKTNAVVLKTYNKTIYIDMNAKNFEFLLAMIDINQRH